ncbi:MAG TPA: ATP-binding protein [Acidimicrobiales bacterium]|nr:ATP-binding protein [Acidimicrobiales bacterium]
MAVTVGGIGVLSGAMLSARGHLSVATTGLVLIVPVVAGVAVGGFPAGVLGVGAGFLVYDALFIPPYGTLSVGQSQNWVVLGVYAVVVLVVSRVVADLGRTRARAHRHEADARRLFEISDSLIAGKGRDQLGDAVVGAVRWVFELRSAALLLPGAQGFGVVAAAGEEFPGELLSRVLPRPGVLVSASGEGEAVSLALSTSSGPLGVLVVVGAGLDHHRRQLLATFANHAALALERAELAEQATRTRVLEEADRWRSALIGSVSHDLRTPLASIKASVSDLREPGLALGEDERAELLAMIEAETDRLTRLVANLLDMTRIEAGALEPRRQPVTVRELVVDAVARVPPSVGVEGLRIEVIEDLPLVDADPVLAGQVLANLLENAAHHAGPRPEIAVRAGRVGNHVEVAVADRGPGIPDEHRQEVLAAFNRVGRPGPHVSGLGLGLAIARAFVQAQGGTIEVRDNPGGGAVVAFTLPVYALSAQVG